MQQEITIAFPNIAANNCLKEETNSYFELFDPASENGDSKEPCYIVYKEDSGHFKVENNENKTIYFAPVDGCIFITYEHRKCDFILFDDRVFCFGDIKNVQKSQRFAARKNAKEQVEVTISLFLEKLDLSSYEIKAVIALTFNKSYPIAKVSTQDAKIRFEDKFNATLYEGNSISF